ncbi:MAG TPA: TMEM165/GDT1 family protein [Acidimicrobiales bacterium]|nr:TMEM165/GDT1 family protein [Acidimicrobiales bacterium]
MNLAVAVATGALVIPAELPDKTFISCVVLASRNRPLPVYIGAALALTVQALVAVVAGGLLALLPHTTVRIVVATLFIAGAAYLIFVPEKAEEEKGERLGERVIPVVSNWRVLLTTFSIIALAEFGDITQVLIANLTARYRDPVGVFLGATVGFWLVAGLGVLAGKSITRYVPLGVVRRISGLILLGFGIWTIVSLVK